MGEIPSQPTNVLLIASNTAGLLNGKNLQRLVNHTGPILMDTVQKSSHLIRWGSSVHVRIPVFSYLQTRDIIIVPVNQSPQQGKPTWEEIESAWKHAYARVNELGFTHIFSTLPVENPSVFKEEDIKPILSNFCKLFKDKQVTLFTEEENHLWLKVFEELFPKEEPVKELKVEDEKPIEIEEVKKKVVKPTGKKKPVR